MSIETIVKCDTCLRQVRVGHRRQERDLADYGWRYLGSKKHRCDLCGQRHTHGIGLLVARRDPWRPTREESKWLRSHPSPEHHWEWVNAQERCGSGGFWQLDVHNWPLTKIVEAERQFKSALTLFWKPERMAAGI